MASFTVGQLQIDVIDHVRVRGEKFPQPDPGAIGEYFTIVAHYQGQPIDFYPNQPKDGARLVFGFSGREVVPIQVGGTKRGADFRTRFFRLAARRCMKAVFAARDGVTISAITDTRIGTASLAERRLAGYKGDRFTDPVNLSLGTIDTAVLTLSGQLPTISEQIPAGTVTNIDVEYDSDINVGGSGSATGTALRIDNSAENVRRTQLRFPLSAITAGSTINDSDLQFNVVSETVEAGEGINVQAYNDTGDDDPESDTGTTKYNRSGGGTTFVSVDCSSTGSKTGDLGATADGQIAGNITSPAFYSIGLNHWGHEEDELSNIEAIENAGTDPATLTVDYTAPAAGDPPTEALASMLPMSLPPYPVGAVGY